MDNASESNNACIVNKPSHGYQCGSVRLPESSACWEMSEVNATSAFALNMSGHMVEYKTWFKKVFGVTTMLLTVLIFQGNQPG
jgi:hypothetical protein